MGFFDTLLLATVVIASGFFVGRMMHNFVDFVMSAIEKHNRDNRD